jgi:hypothetical protein
MQLDESAFKKLSPTQINDIADLLDSLFSDPTQLVELDPPQIQTAALFFPLVLEKSFKQLFFERLDPDTQLDFLETLPESELSYLLPVDEEETVQEASEPKPQEKTPESLRQLFMDLIGLIQDSTLSPAKAHSLAKKKVGILHETQQTSLAKALISQLIALNIPINTPQNFGAYLRFYMILNLFSPKHPAIAKAMIPLIEKTILALNSLPNKQWVIKVLDQLPVGIIEFIIRRLQAYEKVTNFEKRMMYCKLLLDIRDQSKEIPTKALHLVLKQYPIA